MLSRLGNNRSNRNSQKRRLLGRLFSRRLVNRGEMESALGAIPGLCYTDRCLPSCTPHCHPLELLHCSCRLLGAHCSPRRRLVTLPLPRQLPSPQQPPSLGRPQSPPRQISEVRITIVEAWPMRWQGSRRPSFTGNCSFNSLL
jgi:hypothetical protein